MRKGRDRSRAGIPGGTRYICPFCDWFLDMEPLNMSSVESTFLGLIDAVNKRQRSVESAIGNHIRTEHQQEYAEALHVPFSAGEEIK